MPQCAKCKSTNVIEDGAVFDTTRNSQQLLQAGFQENPAALFFTGDCYRPIRAAICGDCGFVEMSIDDPQGLFAEYRRARGTG